MRLSNAVLMAFAICGSFFMSLCLPAWYSQPAWDMKDGNPIPGFTALFLGLLGATYAGLGGGLGGERMPFVLYTICWSKPRFVGRSRAIGDPPVQGCLATWPPCD